MRKYIRRDLILTKLTEVYLNHTQNGKLDFFFKVIN